MVGFSFIDVGLPNFIEYLYGFYTLHGFSLSAIALSDGR